MVPTKSPIPRIRNGRPVEPQVRKLLEEVKIERGEIYKHADLADIIGEEPESTRYRTVIGSWRNRVLRDTGVLLAAVPTVGFEALAAERQIKAGIGKMRSGVRTLRRGLVFVDAAPPSLLPPASVTARDAILKDGAKLLAFARMEVKSFDARVPELTAIPRGRP